MIYRLEFIQKQNGKMVDKSLSIFIVSIAQNDT